MKYNPLEVLNRYWGHRSFRPLQHDIINSILLKEDVLGTLPTGGGKSVCFQVPALCMEGVCLVISPLIALIEDQVTSLKEKGIKAEGLIGSLHPKEVERILDGCIHGNTKFLYASPEKVTREDFLVYLKHLPLSLIVVDEAHCISQWGYDFRPSFLELSRLREVHPNINILALTASATEKIQKDICNKLKLKEPEIFRSSLLRENVTIKSLTVSNKLGNLLSILKSNHSATIIYVRSRWYCEQIAQILSSKEINCTYYHGGLLQSTKTLHAKSWLDNKKHVMVATSAFGMGIDKPDVRYVIHLELPENLENYYQEIGRAGRDGKASTAILLKETKDLSTFKTRILDALPDKKSLSDVYKKLNNYLQIPVNEAPHETPYQFDFQNFCSRYTLPHKKTANCIQFLEQQNILTIDRSFRESIKIRFIASNEIIISFLKNCNTIQKEIIDYLIRTYSGIHLYPVAINLNTISKKTKIPSNTIIDQLKKIENQNILRTEGDVSKKHVIQFLVTREDHRTINTLSKNLSDYLESKNKSFDKALSFYKSDKGCLFKLLLSYFGEDLKKNCLLCSTCKASEGLEEEIKESLSKQPTTIGTLCNELQYDSNKVIKKVDTLMKQGKIHLKDQKLMLTIGS